MFSKEDVEKAVVIIKNKNGYTEEDISKQLNITREHFSRLKKSNPDKLYNRIVASFKDCIEQDYATEQQIIRAELTAIKNAVVKIQAKLTERSIEECLDELDADTLLLLKAMKK